MRRKENDRKHLPAWAFTVEIGAERWRVSVWPDLERDFCVNTVCYAIFLRVGRTDELLVRLGAAITSISREKLRAAQRGEKGNQ